MERRIRIVGLCLIAVFALSAVVADERPGRRRNREVRQGRERPPKATKASTAVTRTRIWHAEGEEATPEEIGLGGKHNKYEWKPGAGGNATFTGKGKEVKITTGALEVKCKTAQRPHGRHPRRAKRSKRTFKFKTCMQPKTRKEKVQHARQRTRAKSRPTKLLGTLSEGRPGKEPLITFAHLKAGVVGTQKNPGSNSNAKKQSTRSPGTLAVKSTQTTNIAEQEGRDRIHRSRRRTGSGRGLPERVQQRRNRRRTDRRSSSRRRSSSKPATSSARPSVERLS